ncbi:MAG: hypothetical protein IJR89_04905 [Clostridia bacterium]|nr:hypothetical protein [Clostridia bacterium]
MKKYIAVILAFAMVFSILTIASSVSVFAADEIDISTPDDAFEGDYTEFKGNDGSVTRVFDNGSVSTKYKDGTTSAVDYNGNRYSEDKEGNASVRTADGYVATEYRDGRKSVTEPNGKTTTMNTDGSFSESFGIGYTLDYNADGGLTGIGITGSDERIETDENGGFKKGEITGPGGSKLTITDDGIRFVNAEGTKVNYTESENKETTTIEWKDGAHSETVKTVTWNGGEKTEDTTAAFTDSNGNRWDSNKNTTYDSNGEPIYSNNNVTEWTGADGSRLWVDNNSKAMEYSDPAGNRMITDAGGNLTEYQDGKNSWNVTYDENGNVTSADITYSDGAKMIKNPDGTTTFTLSDGTKYESDGKGNIAKNGEQIKKDGKWLPGRSTNEAKPDDKSDESTKAKELWKEDRELLQENGFDVTLMRDFLFEDQINAPRGSVTAFISASRREDGAFIKIWYFKDENQASAIALQGSSGKQVGIRFVQGDNENLIH